MTVEIKLRDSYRRPVGHVNWLAATTSRHFVADSCISQAQL